MSSSPREDGFGARFAPALATSLHTSGDERLASALGDATAHVQPKLGNGRVSLVSRSKRGLEEAGRAPGSSALLVPQQGYQCSHVEPGEALERAPRMRDAGIRRRSKLHLRASRSSRAELTAIPVAAGFGYNERVGQSRLSRLAGATVLVGALIHCNALTGVDDLGIESGDASIAPDAFTPDGPSTVVDANAPDVGDSSQPIDATVADGCSSASCVDLPLGFELVAVGPTTDPCPATFEQPKDVHENPVATNGTCTCKCSVGGTPICPSNQGLLTTFGTAGAGTCPNNGGTTGGGCATDGFLGAFDTGNEHRYKPAGPVGGSCTTSGLADKTKVTFTDLRVCGANVVPKCESKLCPPTLGGNFTACVAALGDQACPGAFPKKHLVGPDVNVTCANNGCNCSVSATCTGKMSFFASADCSGAADLIVNADDSCVATVSTPPGTSYGSHRYTANAPANVTCRHERPHRDARDPDHALLPVTVSASAVGYGIPAFTQSTKRARSSGGGNGLVHVGLPRG